MTIRDAATKDGMEIGRTKSNGNVRVNINYLIDNDNCCEIIFPKDYREDMKNIIKTSLENYGVYK